MGVKELRELPIEVIQQAALKQQNPAAAIWAGVIPKPILPADRAPEFSVITCSIDDAKFNGMANCYRQALAGEDYEIIRISDAKGLAEGYARGAAQSRGNILIFSHDDAAPLRPIGARLRNHLRAVDIVAGAGSDRLDGPAWFTAGIPHVFGQVLNQTVEPVLGPDRRPIKNEQGQIQARVKFLLTIYGVPSRLVPNIQVFDGFWFAVRRGVLDVVPFDPDVCESFHMYDVDFSHRAYRAGVKIGVACDLSLAHASTGGYGDAKWKPAAEKWMEARGRGLIAPHRHREFQFAGCQLYDAHEALAIMDQLVECAA